MRKLLVMVSFSAILFGGTFSLTGCNNKSAKTEQKQEVKAYQCPMKCEGDKTYKKEGKCPVCNMKLKEV